MNLVTSKVCIVGDFAVGKTSVAERYVNNVFSEKYLTTVGVKVDTKEVELPDKGIRHKLIIWDVAGTNRFSDIEFAYLRGAAGFIFVADGTRSMTLGTVEDLRREIDERYGRRSAVLLVNKADLTDLWEIDDDRIDNVANEFDAAHRTSAKTGDGVEDALEHLASIIIDRAIEEAP